MRGQDPSAPPWLSVHSEEKPMFQPAKKWSPLAQILTFAIAGGMLSRPIAAVQFSDWSLPQNLGASINSASNEQHPALSPDGLSLYFSSDRPGGAGGFDLWVSRRASTPSSWQSP